MKNHTPSEAINIRRDINDPAIWRRVGTPAEISATEALPFAEFNPFGGNARVLLLAAGRALYVSVAGLPGLNGSATDPLRAPRVFLGMLGGEPLEIEHSTRGVVKVHCRRAPAEYLTFDASGAFTLRGPLPALPSLSIRPDIENTVYTDYSPMKLSGRSKSLSGSAIDPVDFEILSARFLETYNLLKCTTSNSYAALQPVLARYRLRDIFGHTVFLSAPALIAPDDGFQVVNPLRLTSSDQLATVNGGSFPVKTYRLSFTVPETLPAPWDSIVASVEIEATPQLDPVDPEALCQGSKSSVAAAEVYLPGVPSVKSARIAYLRAFVVKALQRAEALMAPVGKLSFPFDGTLGSAGSRKYFRSPRAFATEKELDSAPVTPLSIPGATYAARLTADSLSLRALPAIPLPEPMAADGFGGAVAQGDGLWKSAVAVTISRAGSAETIVRESSAYRDAPLALGPLVVYPDADATELSINAIRSDGTAVARSFHLTPLPEAGLAYWIEPEIARVPLPTSPFGFEVPLDTRSAPIPRQVVEVFLRDDQGRDDPATPVTRVPISGSVEVLAEAPRARNSWDAARRRVLCLGSEGTRLLTFDSKGALRSSNIIDHRPVATPDAVTSADGPDGAMLLAVAGGDLVRFSGSSVATLLPRCGAERPGWSPRWREIWLFGADSPVRRLSDDGEILRSDLPGISTRARCRLWSGALLIAVGGALRDASDEAPTPSLPFRYALDREAPSPPKNLRAAIFDSDIDGAITLAGHNGSERFGHLASLKFRGQVNAPLRLPLVAPRRRYLRLSAEGRASPDLAIRSLYLDFKH